MILISVCVFSQWIILIKWFSTLKEHANIRSQDDENKIFTVNLRSEIWKHIILAGR